MAYCLGTLVGILKQILEPDQRRRNRILDHDKITQIQSLLEKACFLRDALANSAPASIHHSRIESLEDRIRDAAENAEDILESHITTSQILSSTDQGQSFTISAPGLQELIQVFESAKEEMLKIKDVVRRMDNKSPAVSSRRVPDPKEMVVGVAGDLNQLRDRLTLGSSKLEIIPIVGMGGMGKTTLARILYDEYSSSKSSYFDICAWATVSQDHDVQGILLSLLGCITGKPTKELPLEQEDSGLILHKKLFGWRYLIVLDDIWRSKAWDEVQTFFPNENLGSRVILTTRENDVADYVNSRSHVMHFLNQDDSWELLRRKVYGEESCPHELEKVGRRIASNCRGLPLAVQVIGGILSQAERSKDFWRQVSSNVSSFIENADDQFSGIFSLSYAHLPHYLKPCFLYMGAFPEDYKIPASNLIKLWVAEGFLYPIGERILEEAAKVYLKALVDRNLIFVRERKDNGEVKSYGIHDLLRDQCVKKAREKKFLNVINLRTSNLQEDTFRMRRVIVHPLYYERLALDTVKQMTLTRSFISIGTTKHSSHVFFTLPLLRVLDLFEIEFREFPEEILKLLNLRYLALCTGGDLHESLSILRNLQTLIVKVPPIWRFPVKIFDLPQLRHIKLVGMQHPSVLRAGTSYDLQENLQSLSLIPISTLTQFLGKFKNLTKLGICGKTSTDTIDLMCFHNLETLKCSHIVINSTEPCSFTFIFPDSLKKLTLEDCTVPQTCMNAIGTLPNLEILKLRFCSLESSTWEPSEGEFCKLQYLKLTGLDLEDWLADETHFPELRHLAIYYCDDLKEIPLEIGGINTLEIIEVDDYNPFVLESARRIINEQCELGNNLLQLRISSE